MRELSSSSWLRRGSSIVFDKESLGPLISGDSLVPLRVLLGWTKEWPSSPPAGNRTVLVSGLETCLEVMRVEEAERFLRERLKPLILTFQERWDQVGLVFGFGSSSHSFEVTNADEEIIFLKPGGERVRLSQFMWDGSAMLNVTRLVRADEQPVVRDADQAKKRVTVGYHVPRIS